MRMVDRRKQVDRRNVLRGAGCNPTPTIVALSMRQAHYIERQMAQNAI